MAAYFVSSGFWILNTRFQMNITCPHCNFSKQVDPAKLPNRPVKVNCPKCRSSFSYAQPEAASKQPMAV